MIWKSITVDIKDYKLREFNFKPLHQILPCRSKLSKWNIENQVGETYGPNCGICDVEETYVHLFIECKRLKDFWRKIENILLHEGIRIEIRKSTVFLGFKHGSKANHLVNKVVTLAKFAIFKSWVKI